MLGIQAEEVQLDPFEMIAVRFLYPEEYAGAERDQTIYMPAINLRSLHRHQFRGDMQTTVDVGLLFAGGVGLIGAGTRLARAIAAFDLAVGAADLVINNFRHDIARSEEGRDFLAAWDIVSTLIAVYGIARAAIEVPQAVQRARRAWQRLRGVRSTTSLGHLEDSVDEVLDAADEVGDAVRTGASDDAARATTPSDTADVNDGNRAQQTGRESTRTDEGTRRTKRNREERLQELARDPDRGGRITEGTRREAEVAIELETQGRLTPEVRRPAVGDGHSGDFVDGAGGDWDIKAPRSRSKLIEDIRTRARAADRPEPDIPNDRPLRGEFNVDETVAEIRRELLTGENVIIDTHRMTADDIAALRAVVEQAGLGSRVIFFP